MKKHTIILVLIVVVSLFYCTKVNNKTEAQKHPAETFFISGINAFNAHDLEELMKHFHDDFEMYTPMTGWLRGIPSIRERFAVIFQENPSVKMDIDDLHVREVATGTAVVDFKWKVYPIGEGPAYHGITTGVYVLRDGKWGEVLELEHVTQVDEELAQQGN